MMNPPKIDRRRFLEAAVISSGVLLFGHWTEISAHPIPPTIRLAKDHQHLSPFERQHVPQLFMLEAAEDGARVPITVFVANPMEPDHYITSIEILNYGDPIISKGIFYFSPDNARAYLATQVRLDSGEMKVFALATCNRHGRWAGSRNIFVNEGGC